MKAPNRKESAGNGCNARCRLYGPTAELHDDKGEIQAAHRDKQLVTHKPPPEQFRRRHQDR
ncbi:MAG TPA: hypothetical protein VFL49_04255, partial [Pseudolabrys sp.]|nr:hypothetical protein [Pseudolabrys sp.]